MARGRHPKDIEVIVKYDQSPGNALRLARAITLMAEFRRRRTAYDYAAERFGLADKEGRVQKHGREVEDAEGVRYLVLYPPGESIEIASIDCDVMVLVNLDGGSGLAGLWRLSGQDAEGIFERHPRVGGFRTIQERFKAAAELVVSGRVPTSESE